MANKKATPAAKTAKLREGESGTEAEHAGDLVVERRVLPKPPSPGAPHAPRDFVPLDGTVLQGLLKGTESEIKAAPAFLAEIQASKTYAADFGKKAPGQSDLSELTQRALDWEAEARNAEAWLTFASTQRLVAWDAAIQKIRQLQKEFDHATDGDTELSERYPATGDLLGKRREIAARALETKRANKKTTKPA